MNIGFYTAAIGVALSVSALGPAAANHKAASHALAEGRFVLAPFSYTKFCVDYPADCPHSSGAARIHLTSQRMSELSQVNREVNASIIPTPDQSKFRFWALNVEQGDCNEFAVQKRHDLMQRGWSAGSLALSVVKTSWGEGHLVLTVRTDAGDLVLDNLRPGILSWERAGYHWIMRQSERDPQYWASLEGGHAGPVVATQDEPEETEPAALVAKLADASRPATASVARTGDVPEGVVNSALTRGVVRMGRDMILGFNAWRSQNAELEAALYSALEISFPLLGGGGLDDAPLAAIASASHADVEMVDDKNKPTIATRDQAATPLLAGRL